MRKASPEDVPPIYLEALKAAYARIEPREDDLEEEEGTQGGAGRALEGAEPCAGADGLPLYFPSLPASASTSTPLSTMTPVGSACADSPPSSGFILHPSVPRACSAPRRRGPRPGVPGAVGPHCQDLRRLQLLGWAPYSAWGLCWGPGEGAGQAGDAHRCAPLTWQAWHGRHGRGQDQKA